MTMRGTMALFVAVLAVLPLRASADYRYSLWKDYEHRKPYVMVILDTSTSMNVNDGCAYGFNDRNGDGRRQSGETCYHRLDAAKAVLERTLPTISAEVGLGLLTYSLVSNGGTPPPDSRLVQVNSTRRNQCGARVDAPAPADYPTLLAKIRGADFQSHTPLEWSLHMAHEEIKRVRRGDDGGCRDYYVILLTDGEDTCAKRGHSDVLAQVRTMRDDGVRTFIIGFGPDLVDTNGTSNLSQYARAGGTALSTDGRFVCWDDASCGGDNRARAMFAYAAEELDDAITRSLREVRRGVYSAADPIIATVPTRPSEVERVSRNLMVYSAFHMDGDNLRGHLYGLRLFQESAPYKGDWTFTDMSRTDLLDDCGRDKTCVFDAGAMLASRTAPRRIFTGMPGTPKTDEGGYTVPIGEVVELEDHTSAGDLADVWEAFTAPATMQTALQTSQLPQRMPMTAADFREPPTAVLRRTIDWLHAKGRTNGKGRTWPLGDIYHGSAAVVEPPSFNYIDRGYPQYRMAKARRPWMIYTGANDGMIHAFYASPDFENERQGLPPRWQPGEEAWAYLPVNLVGRTMFEVEKGSERFFSMDLSCRYADVILDDKVREVNGRKELQCGDDPHCGWGTVILCGQGWGGSWYVAIDVSDPVNPRPLWEGTIPGPEGGTGTDAFGLGRTWVVPSIALIDLEGKPTWVAVFGNGYNSDMANCPSYNSNNGRCSGDGTLTYDRRASYRMFNLPFDGQYPDHGDGTDGDMGHAWVMRLADGAVLRSFHMHGNNNNNGGGNHPGAFIADAVSIDTDGNAFMDASYLGGWNGRIYRIFFGDKKTPSASDIGMCSQDVINLGTSRRITNNPAVVRDPSRADGVYFFIGSGVDGGNDPDQQRNNGNMWEFRAYAFSDDGTSDCQRFQGNRDVCSNSDWNLSNRARLMGQPLFSRQTDGRDWVLYTTWTPPSDACGGNGVATLWCLDVTNPGACVHCGSLDNDELRVTERSVVIDTGGVPPVSPAVADGNIYVGPIRVPVNDLQGNEPRPNARQGRVVTLSWREVF